MIAFCFDPTFPNKPAQSVVSDPTGPRRMTSFITSTLPQSLREHRPPRILCGRKPRRRLKNPPPSQTRPLPNLPPLPTTPSQPPPQPRIPAASSKSLKAALRSRSDAIVLNTATYTPVLTALFCRENSEHCLIILPTRTNVIHVAALLSEPVNIPKQSRKTRVIVAAGKGGWKYPAMNANSSKHSVIVVATPRAIFHQFFNSHGLPWLGRVRLLVIGHVSRMLENGCGKDLYKVVRKIGSARKTVLVEHDYNKDVECFTKKWVREKHEVVRWDDVSGDDDDVSMKDSCLITATPKQCLEYIIKLVDEREGGAQVVVIFPVARVLEIYATILRHLGRSVIDIHSKTSLGNRVRGLELFKQGGIVFGTDTVLQEIADADLIVSLGAVEEELYKKRAGAGQGIVAVVRPELEKMMKFAGVGQEYFGEGLVKNDDLVDAVGENAKRVAYHCLINYYVGWRRQIGWSRSEVVEFVNVWAREILGIVPEIERKFAGRRRLIGV